MSDKVEYILSIKDLASGSLKTIALSAGNAGHAMDSAKAKTGGLGGAMGKLGIVAGITALAFKGFQFLKESVEDFNAASQAGAQLDATLKSTSYSAGLTREALDKQSMALSKITKYDDDAITSMQSLLLTFTDIKGAVFQEATPAILDLAEKMGGDLKGASIQVGKALNDPIKGVTALSKVGVSFTQQQKDTIKALVNTGKQAEAQRIILAELNKEFGGSAEAAAKAGTGGLTVLANRFGNIKESIGELIVGGLQKLYPVLQNLMTRFEDTMSFIKNNLTQLGEVFAPLYDAISPLVNVFKEMAADMGLAGESGSILKNVFTAIGNVINLLAPLMKFMYSFTALLIKSLYSFIKVIYDAIVAVGKFFGIKGKDFGFKMSSTGKDEAPKLSSFSGGQSGGGGAGTTAKPSKTASMATASKAVNFNVTIDSLVKNMFIAPKERFVESALEIKSKTAEVLIGAVNDFQRTAGI